MARSLRLLVFVGLVTGLGSAARAQAPHVHHHGPSASPHQPGRPGLFSARRGPVIRQGADAYGRPALPRGQVYYGGRYFGSFNNRFYGPQYGYF